MSKANILVVEDEHVVARDLQTLLQRAGYSVPTVVASGEEAVAWATEARPDLVLMDIVLQGQMDGIEAARQITAHHETPVIYLTAYGDDAMLARAKPTEPIAYIMKPYDERELLASIEMALHQYLARRRRAEAELRASEERYRRLVDNAVTGVYQTALDGTILFANPELARLLNFDSPADLIGTKTIERYKNPPDRARMLEILQRDRQIRSFETDLVTREGEIRTVLLSAWTEDEHISGMVRDITERKRAVEALQQSEERYRSLVTATSQIVWTTNAQGEVVGDLPTWRAYTGQSQAETQGWGWSNALHPDDRQRTAAIWSQAVATAGLYDTEYRIRRYDGAYRDFAARGVPVLEPGGSIREWVGTCTDITERKAAEQHIRRLNRLYAMLSQVNQVIARVKEPHALFGAICKMAVEHGGFRLAWIGRIDHETGQVTPVTQSAAVEARHPLRTVNLRLAPFRAGVMGMAAASGKAAFCEDIQTDPAMQHWRAMALAGGFHSMAAIPLHVQGKLCGLLNLYATEPGSFADEAEQKLLEEIGVDVSFALDSIQAEAQRKAAEEEVRILNAELEQRVRDRTAALRVSEEQYRLLFETANDGVVLHPLGAEREDSRFTRFNDVICRMLGYSAAEMAQLSLFDIQTPEELQATLDEIDRLRSDRQLIFEKTLVGKDGRRVSAEIHSTIFDLHGQTMALSIIHDITARKRFEAELQHRAEELNAANADLAAFNQLAVGRELRMIELKEEINALCAVAGQPPRYNLDFAAAP